MRSTSTVKNRGNRRANTKGTSTGFSSLRKTTGRSTSLVYRRCNEDRRCGLSMQCNVSLCMKLWRARWLTTCRAAWRTRRLIRGCQDRITTTRLWNATLARTCIHLRCTLTGSRTRTQTAWSASGAQIPYLINALWSPQSANASFADAVARAGAPTMPSSIGLLGVWKLLLMAAIRTLAMTVLVSIISGTEIDRAKLTRPWVTGSAQIDPVGARALRGIFCRQGSFVLVGERSY